MFSKDCINAAVDKLKDFTSEEIEEYLSEVYLRAKSYDNLGSQASIDLAIKEVNNSKLESLLEDSTMIARNANIERSGIDKIKKGITLDELTVRARSGKNLDYNIESAQRSKKNDLHKTFYDQLSVEETKFLDDGHDQDIGNAIDGRNASPEAKKIAKSHEDLFLKSSSDLVNSNALPSYAINKNRQLHVTHDRVKMMHPGQNFAKILLNKKTYKAENSREIWKNMIKKEVNLKETYVKVGAVDESGAVDMARVDKHLDRTWDNITTGKKEIFTKSSVLNDSEAIEKKKHMFFVWNDTSSWLRYNKEYGSGDYHSAVRNHINSTANKVGTAEILGSSPNNMFMKLMKKQQESNPQKPLKLKATEKNYKYITGMDKAAVSPTLAAFGANLRTLTGMARLGTIGIQSISDVVKGASHASKFGFGFAGPAINNFMHIFNNPLVGNADRQKIAKIFKLNLESHMGYAGKWADANTVGDSVSKFTNKFYRMNLMHALDKGNKISIMHMMAKGLAESSSSEFSGLSKPLKFQLNKYNINENEWNILRHKNKEDLFTTDNVEALTKDDLRSLQVGENANKPLYEIKNDLSRKVYTMFDVANNAAIGQPDAYMNAFLSFGENGTWAGESLKALMQFKAFPLQHIDRMYINAFKELDGTKAKAMYFGSMFAASFSINMLSKMLEYPIKGQTFPDLNQMSVPERVKFFGEAMDTNIGLFYRMTGNSYSGKMKALNLLSSPTTEFIGNMLDSMMNAGMGGLSGDSKELKRAAKSAKAAAKGVIPGSTMPFIGPYMNELMDQKSYAEPGQKQIFGK